MALEAGTAYLDVLPLLKNFSSELQKQATPLLKRVGTRLSSVGRSLTRSITLPIVAAGAAAVVMDVNFETTFGKIKALSGRIGEPLAQAKNDVLALAQATGQDPGGLAEALYFAASAGLKARQVMPVLAAGAKAAEAQFSDTQTAVQLLTSLLNAYAGSGLTATKAMDILTATIRVGKAEPVDLAENLGTVITAAAQAKVSFQEVGAAVATATDLGISAQRAITGLRFLISNISAPTDKAAAALKEYGISIGDLQKAVAEKGLIATLQGLADKFDLNTTKGKAAWAAITGGARGAVVANTLVGDSADLARRNLEATSSAAGDFNKAVAKMSATPAVQLSKAFAQLKVAAIRIGAILLPIVVQVAKWIGKVAEAFQHLNPTVQKIIIGVAAFAAVLGPVLIIAGALATAIAAIGTVGLIVAGVIAALVVAGVVLATHWKTVQRLAHTVWNAIEHTVGVAIGAIIGYFADWLSAMISVFQAIIHGAATAFGWIPGIGDKLRAADKAFTKWKNSVIDGLRATSDHFKTFGSTAADQTAKAYTEMAKLNAILLDVARHSRIHVQVDVSGAQHGGIGPPLGGGGRGRGGAGSDLAGLDALQPGTSGRQALTLVVSDQRFEAYLQAVAGDVDRGDAQLARRSARQRVTG